MPRHLRRATSAGGTFLSLCPSQPNMSAGGTFLSLTSAGGTFLSLTRQQDFSGVQLHRPASRAQELEHWTPSQSRKAAGLDARAPCSCSGLTKPSLSAPWSAARRGTRPQSRRMGPAGGTQAGLPPVAADAISDHGAPRARVTHDRLSHPSWPHRTPPQLAS